MALCWQRRRALGAAQGERLALCGEACCALCKTTASLPCLSTLLLA